MNKLILGLLVGCVFFLSSCGGENKNTTVVDSGTYTGVLQEVDAAEQEIYVKTANDKLIELYFTEQTKVLTNNGETSTFNELKENGKVEITVEKKGNKNVPISVKILN